ncbi:MAG: tetratricopeptide repeat protein, partial [Anaerolineales bacterium]|nr:tetratricopeptide repeat protein [Anaerolineales bacterium]
MGRMRTEQTFPEIDDYRPLAAAWQAGDEAAFTAVFVQLANRYLVEDGAALAQLVATVGALPLTTAVAQQQLLYFRALVQRKAGAHAAAAATFDTLLAQPDLEAHLRARALNSRAICHRLLGQPEAALAGYAASLALWQQLDDPLQLGKVRHNMGIIHYQLRQYGAAEQHLRTAVNLFAAVGSAVWLAAAHNELSIVYRDLGRWDEALHYLGQCAAQFRADGLDDQLGLTLLNMGEIRLFQGELAAAKALLSEKLALIETQAYRVDAFLHLGLLHQAQGDLAAAEVAFRQALAEAAERRDILPQVHYRLGDCLRLAGDEAGALAQWTTATAIVEETRQPLRDADLKISLLGQWQQIYEALLLLCLARGEVAQAFAWAERARARAFAEAMQVAATADGVVAAAAIQPVLPQGTAVYCYFTTGVLVHDVPLLRAIPTTNPLRAHLLTPPRTWLFVLTSQQVTAHDCGLDPNQLVMASPRGPQVERFLQEAVLARLHRALLPSLPLPAQLYLIPHGPLHRVPFAALRDENGRF